MGSGDPPARIRKANTALQKPEVETARVRVFRLLFALLREVARGLVPVALAVEGVQKSDQGIYFLVREAEWAKSL